MSEEFLEDNKTNEKEEYKYNITDSSIFVRPMIGYNTDFYSSRYYNTYIDLDYTIYIVLKNFGGVNNKKSEENLISLKHNIYTHSYTENDLFTVFTLITPEEHLEDFDRFLDSKFSKFSKDYKTKLRKFYLPQKMVLPLINEIISAPMAKMKELANALGVDIEVIKEVGEVRNKINLRNEVFNPSDFEKDGKIYEHYRAKLSQSSKKLTKE